jgi:parallel beta-helix repeat protein
MANSSPTIINSELSNNAHAIYLVIASPTIKNNTFINNTGYAISGDAQSFPVMKGNKLQNNGGNGFEIRGGTMESETPVTYNWDDPDIPYAITGYTVVGEKVTLKVAPGMIVKLEYNKLIDIFGRFQAEGTEEKPIYFTSIKDDEVGGDTNADGSNSLPAPGDWGNIHFAFNNRHADSIISNAVIRYGGKHQDYGKGKGGDWYYEKPGWDSIVDYLGAVRIASSSPTIATCRFTQNEAAIYLVGDSQPKLMDNTFDGNVKGNVVTP